MFIPVCFILFRIWGTIRFFLYLQHITSDTFLIYLQVSMITQFVVSNSSMFSRLYSPFLTCLHLQSSVWLICPTCCSVSVLSFFCSICSLFGTVLKSPFAPIYFCIYFILLFFLTWLRSVWFWSCFSNRFVAHHLEIDYHLGFW